MADVTRDGDVWHITDVDAEGIEHLFMGIGLEHSRYLDNGRKIPAALRELLIALSEEMPDILSEERDR